MKHTIVVKTNSKKGPLVENGGADGADLKVYLREKPHDGEANAALVAVLAKYFKVPKTSIAIVSGQKSHCKVVEIYTRDS